MWYDLFNRLMKVNEAKFILAEKSISHMNANELMVVKRYWESLLPDNKDRTWLEEQLADLDGLLKTKPVEDPPYTLEPKINEWLQEKFGKHTPQVHEDMPDEIRKLVHGVLYHLEPAKILRVKRGGRNDWDVNIHSYKQISHHGVKDYMDDIFVKQLGFMATEEDPSYDDEFPEYQHELGLDIIISYEDPDEAELDEPEKSEQPEHGEDNPDWWKKGSEETQDNKGEYSAEKNVYSGPTPEVGDSFAGGAVTRVDKHEGYNVLWITRKDAPDFQVKMLPPKDE
jgi:hypothetical protein